METFDLVVVGAGPGGYPAAIRAAQLGARVALVEKEFLGGVCLNWGCIPTKTLIASAALYDGAKHAADRGIKAGGLELDYAALAAYKDRVVEKLRGGIGSLLEANGVAVIAGTAAFSEPRRIEVRKPGGGRPVRLSAKSALVAVGSEPARPSFLPADPRIMDSRDFLALTELPASMIVMGGGVIGCELACLAAQLGCRVTVLEMLEDILVVLDKDVRREVRRRMERHLKIKIHTGAPVEAVTAGRSGIEAVLGGEKLQAERLLVAVGRRPALESLRPAEAGIALTSNGYIRVDDCFETSVAGIYAVGDVVGGPQLAHAATQGGLVAAEQALGQRAQRAATVMPACIFTAPEVGIVGLTEQAAAQQKRAVKVGVFPFAALGRALAAGEAAGFAKLVADAETDQILGAQVVGPHATELIAEATVAVAGEWTATELGRTVHAHPTLAEIWLEAAHALHGRCIHAAPVRRQRRSGS